MTKLKGMLSNLFLKKNNNNDTFIKVRQYLDKQGVRALVDDRNEKIGRKIRDNELKRVPYMVIVGEKESAEGLVSMRKQGSRISAVHAVCRKHRNRGIHPGSLCPGFENRGTDLHAMEGSRGF